MVKERLVERNNDSVEKLQLVTSDKFPLHATLYHTSKAPEIVAIICSGSGIEQRYYKHFAKYLSENGITVITWDARGVGRSLNGQKTTKIEASYEVWGSLDFETIIQFLTQWYAKAKLALIGHSFGGIYPFFAESSLALHAVVTVATINGNINSLRIPLVAKLLIGMIRLKVHKIIPWRWVLGYDSPHGIIEQWAYWARKKNYFMDHPDFERRIGTLDIPILNIGISDDEIGNSLATQKYHEFFHSQAIYRELYPSDYQLNKIGHNGFFKQKNKKALIPAWKNIIQFLKEIV